MLFIAVAALHCILSIHSPLRALEPCPIGIELDKNRADKTGSLLHTSLHTDRVLAVPFLHTTAERTRGARDSFLCVNFVCLVHVKGKRDNIYEKTYLL